MAFAGISQARNKYTFFAKVARKEGYHYIAKTIDEMAEKVTAEIAATRGFGPSTAIIVDHFTQRNTLRIIDHRGFFLVSI
ncbi:MAG: ferritin family protein [Desulfobacterales bacterium]|nr:ferritin family protein [Desulfobacterales bacterium]MDJ0913430.1 ferritin family protein [Desulfobacterales bacterium]